MKSNKLLKKILTKIGSFFYNKRYSFFEVLIPPIIGILFSFLFLLLIVLFMGQNPIKVIEVIFKYCFSSHRYIALILSYSVPLIFAGLSVSFAFQAGIFNIGVEGQYFFGGLIGALAGIYLKLPTIIHIPVVILFCMMGGAIWAGIPAILKVKRGIHEVITTIMFNNIALALVNYLVNGPFSGMSDVTSYEPRTKLIQCTAKFEKINFLFRTFGFNAPDSVYLDYSLIIAIFFIILMWLILFKTRYGFDIRAVGTSTYVSLYAGIKVKQIQLAAFLISGGIAGLIGLQEIFAIKGFYTYGIASGYGFDGIAIALIAKNNPIGVIFSAFLFGFLKQAGYGIQYGTSVPNSGIYVITGILIISIVVINEIVKRYIKNLIKKESL